MRASWCAMQPGPGQAGLRPTRHPGFDTALDARGQGRDWRRPCCRAMSMTDGHARLVLLLGHGAQVTNNPHESAYHCGACGGQTGEVSARLLAALLNDPETRAGLPAHGHRRCPRTRCSSRACTTPPRTRSRFTTMTPPRPMPPICAAARGLAGRGAAHAARAERAARLPGATGRTSPPARATGPKCGPNGDLPGCAAFIAAPRAVTRRPRPAGPRLPAQLRLAGRRRLRHAGADPDRARSSSQAGSACNTTARPSRPRSSAAATS